MLRKAEKKADEAELFYSSTITRTYRTVLDRVEATESTNTAGFGLRVIKDERVGFSFFTREKEFEKALERALSSAKFSKKIKASFPSEKIKSVNEINKEIDKSDEFFVDSVLAMASVSEEAVSIQNEIEYEENKMRIVNSNGVDAEYGDNIIAGFSSYKYEDNVFYYYDSFRKMINFSKIAEEAAEKSIELSKGKPLRGVFNITFAPMLADEFLSYFLHPNVNGEKVFLKESAFVGRRGDKVANENLSIYDDPTIKFGVHSCPFDDEGVKTKKHALIEEGALVNFLYDVESAALSGNTPTGNGFRSSFTRKPSISMTNVVVKSTDKLALEEFTGVVVYGVIGMHNSNALTGDFSLSITNAVLVEKGEIKRPVSYCSISGNFFKTLKEVKAINDETRIGSYYGPSIVFKARLV